MDRKFVFIRSAFVSQRKTARPRCSARLRDRGGPRSRKLRQRSIVQRMKITRQFRDICSYNKICALKDETASEKGAKKRKDRNKEMGQERKSIRVRAVTVTVHVVEGRLPTKYAALHHHDLWTCRRRRVSHSFYGTLLIFGSFNFTHLFLFLSFFTNRDTWPSRICQRTEVNQYGRVDDLS